MSKKHSQFTLNTHDLPRRAGEMKEYSLDFVLKEKVGTELIGVSDLIHCDARLESVEEGVLVSAQVDATARGECSRCLAPVVIDVHRQIQELYRYQPTTRGRVREEEINLDEDDELMMDGEIMDLEVPIRDAIILSLPINPLCSPDCEGLCPECGEPWATLPDDHEHEVLDVRWSGLEELKKALGDGANFPNSGS